MFKAGDRLVLSLWDVDAFTAEVGQAPGGGLAPLTLSHNLATTDGVDRVLEQARAAGAQHVDRRRGARVGWLLRLLRRPRRLPLGDLPQPRTHRPGGAPMSDGTSDRVTYDDVAAAGLDDWRMLVSGIHARFATGSFAAGVRLVDAIGAAADEADHHPDVTLTYPRVDVALISHDVGRVTDRDLALARRISEIAAGSGRHGGPVRAAAARARPRLARRVGRAAVLARPPGLQRQPGGGRDQRPARAPPCGAGSRDSGSRGAPAALAPRRVGARRPGAGAHRRGGRGRRAAGRGVSRALVLGARGRARATAPASARPRGAERGIGGRLCNHMARPAYQIVGQVADSVDAGTTRRRR